jgi:ribonucleoside-diphosphate reductase alpha chain
MGFQDALYLQNIPYDSEQAVEFADSSMEQISYYTIEASCDLAKERGVYESFEGSLWSQGILPIDSINLLAKSRGAYLKQDVSQKLDWNKLRNKVRTLGMRNSNTMAIAPTATISNICGVSQSIEPTYQNLYVKSNMSGEFTVINPYLVQALKKQDLWDVDMINYFKYFDGSLHKIDRVPDNIKNLFKTAFEIDSAWLIQAASRRQKWIDQAQSLNIYIAQPSGKILDQVYKDAWLSGLKTTYYLRSLGASSAEKSTYEKSELNAVKTGGPKDSKDAQELQDTQNIKVCSILDPSCESCQ